MLKIKKLIIQLRPDLQVKFAIKGENKKDLFLTWLVTSGLNEYKALSQEVGLRELFSKSSGLKNCSLTKLQLLILKHRPDVQKVFNVADNNEGFLTWFYTHGLEEHGYWDLLSPVEQTFVKSLPSQWLNRLQPVMVSRYKNPVSRIAFKKRKFGVNLIGYAFGQLGIGEDVRMAGKALLSINIPMTMLDFPPGDGVGQNDRTMTEHVSSTGDFAFNIFPLTAEETGRYYAERGRDQFVDRYNIGYWPWELGSWPQEWNMLFDLVDEVWVSSQHTFDSIRPVCKKPLYLMPMAVELGAVKKFRSKAQARNYFNLPEKAKLFCFSFDLKSYVDRKNPRACIDAFIAAFPKREFKADQVGLVVKVHKPSTYNAAWSELKKIARSDKRIHIIEQTLDRKDLLALFQSCNCYISLHRAEGFGRGLAEALQLGLHVICTGYSGNVDFCQPPQADLVKYRLIKVKRSQYPHAKGQVWAEPSVKHAAKLMRQFYDHGVENPVDVDFSGFSPEVVGQRYKSRLKEIWASRNEEGRKKLRLAFSSDVHHSK